MLFKKKSIKYLKFGIKNITGRNNSGKLVLYRRWGGHKKNLRMLDLSSYIWNIYGIILRFEYDPIRNSFISLILYGNGILTYKLSIKNTGVGVLIWSKNTSYLLPGYTSYIKNFKSGLIINSIALKINFKSQYIRTFNNFAKILTKLDKSTLIKLKSKEIMSINNNCLVILGIIYNKNQQDIKYKKASYYWYKGWRPFVRGVAMNPIDHPHGGGQGKTSGGRPSVTPWGKYTKGIKTRRKKNDKIYLKR